MKNGRQNIELQTAMGQRVYERLARTHLFSHPCSQCSCPSFHTQPCSVSSTSRTPQNPIPIHLHGSDFGRCVRAIYFNATQPPLHLSAAKQLHWTDGHLHEAGMKFILRKVGFRLSPLHEKEYTFIFPFVLHPDGQIEWNGDTAILECKSVADSTFKRILREHMLPWAYYGQVHIYMLGFRIPQVILVLKNRNTGWLAFLRIPFDREYVLTRKQRFEELAHCFRQKTLPQREFERTSRECYFCEHREQCWNDHVELRERSSI